MITPSDIYWLTRLDVINVMLLILTALTCIGAAFVGMGYLMFSADKDEEGYSRWLGKLAAKIAIVCGIFAALAVLTPTTKEAAAIIVIPRIANSESVQQLGEGVVALAQDWLKELSPKKGETNHD